MKKESSIQWTDFTWNVARGCEKVDADCLNCYMYRDSMNGTRYKPREVVRTKTVFNFPLKLKEKKSSVWAGRPLIFTSSLTDVFIDKIDPYRNEIWDIIRQCPQFIFQILTKRPERINNHLPPFWDEIKERVWLGTSVGSQKSIHRVIELLKVKAKTHCTIFLSIEPLHSPVVLKRIDTELIPGLESPWCMVDALTGRQTDMGRPCNDVPHINWVIVGGESGNDHGQSKFRPCEIQWLESIVAECKVSHIPVFVKQMGTHISKELKMSDRHGGNFDEFPETLQIREFPNHIK